MKAARMRDIRKPGRSLADGEPWAAYLKNLACRRASDHRTAIWGGYNAVGCELDPLPLTATARWTDGVSARPWFADLSSEMLFRRFDGDQERGPFNIPQPSAKSPLLDPDTVLVPLLAVDLKGNRLGQGAGHYDRALRRLRRSKPVVAVGIAWECQIVDEVPVDPWDEPLDYVATPDRLVRVSG